MSVEDDVISVIGYRRERSYLRSRGIIVAIGNIDVPQAREFVEDLEIIKKTCDEPIRILLSSPGGEVGAGITIIQAIQEAIADGYEVNVEVLGQAMSMAFLIVQACSNRVMGGAAVLMAHGITAFMAGDIRNQESEMVLLRFWQELFADMITKRCSGKNKYSKDYWQKVLKDQTPQYFTSDEALEIGLIDEVR